MRSMLAFDDFPEYCEVQVRASLLAAVASGTLLTKMQLTPRYITLCALARASLQSAYKEALLVGVRISILHYTSRMRLPEAKDSL